MSCCSHAGVEASAPTPAPGSASPARTAAAANTSDHVTVTRHTVATPDSHARPNHGSNGYKPHIRPPASARTARAAESPTLNTINAATKYAHARTAATASPTLTPV